MGGETSSTSTECTESIWPYVWAIREPECLDWKTGLNSEEIQVLAARQADLPVPITTTIYLSDHKSVCDVQRLSALGITHVLNVAGVTARGPLDEYKSQGITYKEVNADDEEGYDMLGNHLQECRSFIENAAISGKCVVHCVAGINRSGVIVAAMHLLSGDPDSNVLKTVAHCRRHRSNCFLWNHSFQVQLVQFAKLHNLLGPPPGDTGCCVAELPPPYIAEDEITNAKAKKKSIKNLF